MEIGVVPDRERIRRGASHARVVGRGRGPLKEAVHLAEVVLDKPALPAMIRVAVPAALEVRSEGVVRVGIAVDRGHEPQVVPTIGAGQPAEEMVERAVLHHQDDDVADATRAVGTYRARGIGHGLAEQVGAGNGEAGRGGRDLKELPA